MKARCGEGRVVRVCFRFFLNVFLGWLVLDGFGFCWFGGFFEWNKNDFK